MMFENVLWQDFVIMFCNVVLSYALIPTIYHSFKKKETSIRFQTALLTSSALYLLAFSLFTLSLFFAAAVTFVSASLWLTIFFQIILYSDGPAGN